ncbi:EAL domain-containing protein [Massilia sp. GCM10020059]|uniref:EAL domain-containing protein n=1 Tax=Massilia agrisoli TaxID=2892444 RepID=A0ABS8IUN7_9BURK|nr:EAL domain-containing protein [Massilia agrisoli]MCC6070975.1 EAL domain-containing protein [Massilia agrisoli]
MARQALNDPTPISGARPSLIASLFWPVAALILIVAVWSTTIVRANAERTEADKNTRREANAAAQAYEQYVTRSVAQMDQVSMQLKQSWEQSNGRLRLEHLTRDGMFLDSAFISVSVVDARGKVVSSTQPGELNASYARSAFFRYHRNNNSSSLKIDTPLASETQVHPAVLFSRRLDTPDDDFDGVVVLTVPSDYLTSFYMPAALGRDGLVATVGTEAGLRLEQQARAGAATAFPRDAALWAAPAGVLLSAAGQFPDGQARFLAWRHSPVYPLVALVALSKSEAMAAAETYWTDGRNDAAFASFCLALIAALATVLSRRAAHRQSAQEDVRLAYRTATESANDGFYMAAALRNEAGVIVDFEIVDCNERGAYFYGSSRAELIGKRLSTIDAGVFGNALLDTYSAAMTSGFYEDEREMPADARLNIRWGHRRLVRVGNGLAVTLRDISERKAHVVELERLANEDMLTGLPNRHWLMGFLPGAMAASRSESTELSLLFIDLDEFKQVNDLHGHAVGDQLLKASGERLRSLLRPGDHVVRFGGDEFIVLLMPSDAQQQAARVAERIISAFQGPFTINGEPLQVGASVGISVFPHDAADAASLIKHGDIAMYAGKTDGKGQYRFFEASQSRLIQSRLQLKHRLLEAIELDQFVLYYQPRVDAFTGEVCSMEALVRWIHPQHGLVSPLEFIPMAETTGLILRIGEMVMEKACRQIDAWRRQGLPVVPVSINVSPKQFARGEVHRQLAVYLDRHQVPASLLEVEITESAMMGEQEDVLAELGAIRALGVKLHVDDFGTGYSSLSQLQKLKMDVLKVDRAFTSELGNSREGRVFFQAIVSMAHALGMSVVAEGVETAEQLCILQELGCNEVQGYYLARPMPAADIPAVLEQGLRSSVVPAKAGTHTEPAL